MARPCPRQAHIQAHTRARMCMPGRMPWGSAIRMLWVRVSYLSLSTPVTTLSSIKSSTSRGSSCGRPLDVSAADSSSMIVCHTAYFMVAVSIHAANRRFFKPFRHIMQSLACVKERIKGGPNVSTPRGPHRNKCSIPI